MGDAPSMDAVPVTRWEHLPNVGQSLLEGADRIVGLLDEAALNLDSGRQVNWQIYDDLTHEKYGAIVYMRRKLDQIEACAKKEAERRGW